MLHKCWWNRQKIEHMMASVAVVIKLILTSDLGERAFWGDVEGIEMS
jgi:hypothetical protein